MSAMNANFVPVDDYEIGRSMAALERTGFERIDVID